MLGIALGTLGTLGMRELARDVRELDGLLVVRLERPLLFPRVEGELDRGLLRKVGDVRVEYKFIEKQAMLDADEKPPAFSFSSALIFFL